MSISTARFQPYVLPILDCFSSDGFSKRHLVTFTSPRRRTRFRRFLRRECRARRQGNWVVVPGAYSMNRAVDYAARHGSYIYDLPLKKSPSRRRRVAGDELSEDEFDESEEENVPETELLSEDER